MTTLNSISTPNGVTVKVELRVNGNEMSATVDSGAELTVLRYDLLQECKIDKHELKTFPLRSIWANTRESLSYSTSFNRVWWNTWRNVCFSLSDI